MKKRIAFLVLVIGLPVMAQVQLEVDAVKPRTIYASEAAETIIERGEIVVDPDVGMYLGDGVNVGGIDLTPTNKVLRTGSTMSGDLNMSEGASILFGGTNIAKYYQPWDEEYAELINIDEGEQEPVFFGSVRNGNAYYAQNYISWDGDPVLSLEECYLADMNGLPVIAFGETNAIYISNKINMDGNAIEDVSALYLSGTNAITDDGTNLLRNGVAIGSGTETDPVFTNWLATSYEGATGGVSAAQAGVIATNTLATSLASAETNSAASKGQLTRATWAKMGSPPANWAISDTNGAAQIWRLTAAVTNIYAGSGTTNHIEAFTLKVYPGTNSISSGAASWATSAAKFTNSFSVIDALVDGSHVDLFLLREGDE